MEVYLVLFLFFLLFRLWSRNFLKKPASETPVKNHKTNGHAENQWKEEKTTGFFTKQVAFFIYRMDDEVNSV